MSINKIAQELERISFFIKHSYILNNLPSNTQHFFLGLPVDWKGAAVLPVSYMKLAGRGLHDPRKIFEFFKNPPVEDIEIEKQELQPEKLLEMLCDDHSFSRERMGSVVDRLKELKDKEKQSSLGRFF